MQCKSPDKYGKEVGEEKEASKCVGDIAGEIKLCLPAKVKVL